MLVDTHCHIHDSTYYPFDKAETLQRAHNAGVSALICVGTSEQSSREAVEFATGHAGVFASVGVHPHDSEDGWGEVEGILVPFLYTESSPPPFLKQTSTRLAASPSASLLSAELATAQTSSTSKEVSRETAGSSGSVSSQASGEDSAGDTTSAQPVSSRSTTSTSKYLQPEYEPTPLLDLMPGAKPFTGTSSGRGEQNQDLNNSKIVAIGEIGLDYFYTHSPREVQIKALETQIDLALKYNLPIIFHVRDAFDDFWPIFDNFHGLRGELHSFTDTASTLEEGLKRGLYIGVNGISTFTKDEKQKAMFANIPLSRLLLETDAPFLTPAPLRGKVNEPAFVRTIAEHHAQLRGLSLTEIATATTANAQALFTRI